MSTTSPASRSVGFILLLAVAGCGSPTLSTSDAGLAGHDGGSGDTPTGAGGAAGAGGDAAGTGGAGGETGGPCETNDDCVLVTQCCGGICLAKTDPAPAPTFCSTSCVFRLTPSTCGCVNHRCSNDSACIVPGSGLCPDCPNGYLTGPGGCQTCACAPTDAGMDSTIDANGDSPTDEGVDRPVDSQLEVATDVSLDEPLDEADGGPHALDEACDDGRGCDPGLVCKAVGDPCPTYPKCKVCYRPCGDGGACPAQQICLPPVGQGGNVCI
jgi:hypothetical protein